MEKKRKLTILTIVAISIISIAIIGVYATNFYETEVTIELGNFQEMARNTTTCADIRNELFVIDNQMVFWAVEGNCMDASYAYTLFGKNPQEVLCKKYDSIAGPQEYCNEEGVQKIFQVIINNLDSDDLGLGWNHQVRQILF